MNNIFNYLKQNKILILLISFFIFLTLIVIGITYAYYDLKSTGETVSSVQIGGATISANFVLTMII